MRRVGLAVLVAGVGVTGCDSFRDVFTSHAETAARVESRELKSSRVAEIITKLGGPTANPQAAELIANVWVDLSLFGDRVAAGTIKSDSATINELIWPQLAEQKVTAWHDTVLARRTALNPAAVDSLYNGGDVRLFQHILFMAAGPAAADTAKAKATADRVVPETKSGDFGKLAAQYSSDGSKTDKGYLTIAPRGAFVPEFENAAWALPPGGVSPVVKSQYGFHIIRRPTLEESRDRWTAKAKDLSTAHQDSLYMAELASKENLVVKSGAAAALKDAVTDLSSARKSKKELASTKSGPFTVGDMARWIEMLPAQALQQIKAANDSLLSPFIKTVAQNSILLRQADSAKIAVNPTIHQALIMQMNTQIGGIREAIGLNGPEFSDSSKTPPAERKKLAAEKVEQYFEKLVAGQAQYRPVPPTLSGDLRAAGDYKVYPAGVSRAIELIIAKKKADSAAGGAAAPGAPRPGGLQTAPGGPPTPSAPPADTTKRP